MLRKKKCDSEKVDPKQNDNRKLWPRITRSTPPSASAKATADKKKDGK